MRLAATTFRRTVTGVAFNLFAKKVAQYHPSATPASTSEDDGGARRVLNVGGGSRTVAIPAHYVGWTHHLLDIDPIGNPDVLCDARMLDTLEPATYDAVYCSHNLEHYYRHDVGKVLRGFLHVLKRDGFAEIRVPDMRSVMRRCVADDLDIEAVLYVSAAGPITVRDVFYGWAAQIEKSGVDFYAHKTGFTARSLTEFIEDAGFEKVFVAENEAIFEVSALAFKQPPAEWHRQTFGL